MLLKPGNEIPMDIKIVSIEVVKKFFAVLLILVEFLCLSLVFKQKPIENWLEKVEVIHHLIHSMESFDFFLYFFEVNDLPLLDFIQFT